MQLFRTKSVEQTIAETGEEGRKLKRNLTWWDLSIMGVAVAVGAQAVWGMARNRPGRDHQLPDCRHRLRRGRDVLRRVCLDDSSGRFRLYLHLYHGG